MSAMTYEMDGEVFEFSDLPDLEAALDGDYGEEYQLVARQVAADLEQADEPTQDAAEFSAQAVRLERDLGRELTAKEINALAQDQAGTGPPDVKESYDRVLNRDLSNDDDRHAVMRETMEEAEYAQDAEVAGRVSEGAE